MSERGPTLPFVELMDSGLLWLINTTTFHPRGLALALVVDEEGNALGWRLIVAPDDEPFVFHNDDAIVKHREAQSTIEGFRISAALDGHPMPIDDEWQRRQWQRRQP